MLSKNLEKLLQRVEEDGSNVISLERARMSKLLDEYVQLSNSNTNIAIKTYNLTKFLFKHRNNLLLKEEVKKLRDLKNEG